MCGCGSNITDLGCFPSCEDINTRINATVTGNWTVRICFNGVWLTKEVGCTVGQAIVIENDYPENILLVMQLIKPDGKPMSAQLYSFKNKICV